VYPELVVNGADGNPGTVAYHLLPAILLNELQKQSRQLEEKDAQISALQRQLDAQATRLDALERQARASLPERLVGSMH
jgi:uncharacterized protein YPO0396